MKNPIELKSTLLKFFHLLIRSRIFYIMLSVSIVVIVVESSSENSNELDHPDHIEAAFADLEEDFKSNINAGNDPVFATKADSMIAYAQTLEGIPYKWAGKTADGFDCSGFIYHVFNKFGVDLPASSAVIFTVGTPVTKEALVKGDLVFFTGTDTSIRKVGHVGIISSEPGDKLQFIHSSSGGGGRGVTVNDLDHPHYTARYFGAKRVELM